MYSCFILLLEISIIQRHLYAYKSSEIEAGVLSEHKLRAHHRFKFYKQPQKKTLPKKKRQIAAPHTVVVPMKIFTTIQSDKNHYLINSLDNRLRLAI